MSTPQFDALATELKKSVGESLADALTECDLVLKVLDNHLNKTRKADLAAIATIQSSLQGAQRKLATANVSDVPYFGGDMIALAANARNKTRALVNDMRLYGITEIVSDTVASIGAGAGRTLADTLRPLFPLIYTLTGAILILAVAFFIIQRGKGRA